MKFHLFFLKSHHLKQLKYINISHSGKYLHDNSQILVIYLTNAKTNVHFNTYFLSCGTSNDCSWIQVLDGLWLPWGFGLDYSGILAYFLPVYLLDVHRTLCCQWSFIRCQILKTHTNSKSFVSQSTNKYFVFTQIFTL